MTLTVNCGNRSNLRVNRSTIEKFCFYPSSFHRLPLWVACSNIYRRRYRSTSQSFGCRYSDWPENKPPPDWRSRAFQDLCRPLARLTSDRCVPQLASQLQQTRTSARPPFQPRYACPMSEAAGTEGECRNTVDQRRAVARRRRTSAVDAVGRRQGHQRQCGSRILRLVGERI